MTKTSIADVACIAGTSSWESIGIPETLRDRSVPGYAAQKSKTPYALNSLHHDVRHASDYQDMLAHFGELKWKRYYPSCGGEVATLPPNDIKSVVLGAAEL